MTTLLPFSYSCLNHNLLSSTLDVLPLPVTHTVAILDLLPFVQPLPEFSRIPGLILPGCAVSDCLMLMQFLRGFGKVLGLDLNLDVPTLGMLQEGLLNVGDSMGHVQDLLVKLLSLAVCDPGLPPGQKVS